MLQIRSSSGMNAHSWLLLIDSLHCTDYFDLSWHLEYEISPRLSSDLCALDSPQYKLLITILFSPERLPLHLPMDIHLLTCPFLSPLPWPFLEPEQSIMASIRILQKRAEGSIPPRGLRVWLQALWKPIRTLEERKDSAMLIREGLEIVGNEKRWRWQGKENRSVRGRKMLKLLKLVIFLSTFA